MNHFKQFYALRRRANQSKEDPKIIFLELITAYRAQQLTVLRAEKELLLRRGEVVQFCASTDPRHLTRIQAAVRTAESDLIRSNILAEQILGTLRGFINRAAGKPKRSPVEWPAGQWLWPPAPQRHLKNVIHLKAA